MVIFAIFALATSSGIPLSICSTKAAKVETGVLGGVGAERVETMSSRRASSSTFFFLAGTGPADVALEVEGREERGVEARSGSKAEEVGLESLA